MDLLIRGRSKGKSSLDDVMLITTVMSVIGLVLALFLRNGRSAPAGCCSGLGWAIVPTIVPRSSPAASNSVSRLRGHW